MRDHRLIDQRSLAFARLIAEKLRSTPGMVADARANLSRWRKTCSPGVTPTLDEWDHVLSGTVGSIIDMLTREDEHATRLRQSNPFAGALTNEERNRIILQYYDHEAART